MTANQPTNQPDHVNKQTNKQTRVEVTTLWLRGGAETDDLLKRARVLAARDNLSLTGLTRAAFVEYVNNHYPGNPGLPLTHWTSGEPLSIAAQEKLSHSKLPPAGNIYNLKCRFCGTWFETDKDMPLPACPKCAKKPEGST
jgi:hypothetical protein